MINIKYLLDEALTIPADKAGPVELKLRDALAKRKDCKHEDVIIKCCRSAEKSGKLDTKELVQTYVVGLSNIIDLLKVYDKCKEEYIQQKLTKKVKLERADGRAVELDPLRDLNKISRLRALKQFVERLESMVKGDTSIQTSFKKYAIDVHDRECIRLMCWNSRVMVWGTREFAPSQKFAVQLWQNIKTIDSGAAYGNPDKQCPYCTHSREHWNEHSAGDDNYEQYWYLKIPAGAAPSKRGNLNEPSVVKIYNALKGLGPEILICQHDSEDDWCDRDDNPISEHGIDIHDAGEPIYLDDDGEVVDPEDGYEEQLEFNFGPRKEDFYSDVIELYDRWFTDGGMIANAAKQPWETESQYRSRKTAPGEFAGFVGDLDNARDGTRDDDGFDFEHSIWTQPIELGPEHFRDGILAIQLPERTSNQLKVKGAKIASFIGFPKDFIGSGERKLIKLEQCELESAGSWSLTSESKRELSLFIYGCTIRESFKLGNALSGASLSTLELRASRSQKSLRDFKLLSGAGKLKSISKLLICDFEAIKSFEGLAEALEDQKIQLIQFYKSLGHGSSSIQINSFKGLPAQAEVFKIDDCQISLDAAKDMAKWFPQVTTQLALDNRDTELEILDLVFRAAWTKAGPECKLRYSESHASYSAGLSLTDALEDKAPSRFKDLPKKKLKLVDISLDLSPRNRYEEKAFLHGESGFSSAGVFDPSLIPLFQSQRKTFVLKHGKQYPINNTLAVVQAGKIVCFSDDLEAMHGPFTKKTFKDQEEWTNVCLDDDWQGQDFSLDEALKAFLRSRKTDFPETKTLVMSDGFKGNVISGIDDEGLILKLSRGGCPNLIEVSRCKLAGIQDERGATLHWDDKRTFQSPTTYRDCVIAEGSSLDAKVISKCTIIPRENTTRPVHHSRSYVIASDGIFDSKISSKLSDIQITTPVIEGCNIEYMSGSISLNGLKKLINTRLSAIQIRLDMMSDFYMSSGCTLEITRAGGIIEVRAARDENESTCSKIASAIVKSLKGTVIKVLDLSKLACTSLKFLEDLSAEVKEISQVILDISKLEDFKFKLKDPGKVVSVGNLHMSIKDISQDATLDGFDASVQLAFGYPYHVEDGRYPSRGAEQFCKYFTYKSADLDAIPGSKGVDPNYTDKNGQFTAPKTLEERLFGRPTLLEEASWLKVLKLLDR